VLVREGGDRSEQLGDLERQLRAPPVEAPVGGREVVVGQGHLRRPRRAAPTARDELVAQRPQQVAEVVLVPQEPRPSQHAYVGLLHEILGVVGVPGQRPRRPEEPVDVVAKQVGVQPAWRRHPIQLTVNVPSMPSWR
jgi:hypothetical protein